MELIHGECLVVMRGMADNSVDSVVTDPPYGLKFMGKRWDCEVPGVEVWRECLRVLKPGGYLLSFAGTRTQHRMACNIEDAGFEIRDMISWIYGSGFPKSLNLHGEWEGFGTALKPAMEPITVARKPIEGTVADNVEKWGVGGLNIDGCRVEVDPNVDDMLRVVDRKRREAETWDKGSGFKNEKNHLTGVPSNGRWPANLIHDGSDDVVSLFPDTKSGLMKQKIEGGDFNVYGKQYPREVETIGDSGSAARFFYCAKVSRSERNMGCGNLTDKDIAYKEYRDAMENTDSFVSKYPDGTDRPMNKVKNNHPTVKPIALMSYLCRLVTPPKGIVLDPFMGSGSTGIGALQEGFNFIGIERDGDYYNIAKLRIGTVDPLFNLG